MSLKFFNQLRAIGSVQLEFAHLKGIKQFFRRETLPWQPLLEVPLILGPMFQAILVVDWFIEMLTIGSRREKRLVARESMQKQTLRQGIACITSSSGYSLPVLPNEYYDRNDSDHVQGVRDWTKNLLERSQFNSQKPNLDARLNRHNQYRTC